MPPNAMASRNVPRPVLSGPRWKNRSAYQSRGVAAHSELPANAGPPTRYMVRPRPGAGSKAKKRRISPGESSNTQPDLPRRQRANAAAATLALPDRQRGGVELTLSQRQACGRTSDRLCSLAGMHLFAKPKATHGTLDPAPGLFASHRGDHVYIMGVFSRRGVPMADVLTLEPLENGSFVAALTKVWTLAALAVFLLYVQFSHLDEHNKSQ